VYQIDMLRLSTTSYMACECPNLNNARHSENRNSLATVPQTNTQKSAPLESESVQLSKNLSVTKLIEVYATKRRKDNSGKPVEVEDSPGTENAEAETDETLKRKPVKKRKTKPIDPQIITNIQPYSVIADLQNKKADITYAQLFQAAPNMKRE
ncbi:6449_t:CDS:2, partial [Gigaspora margarita]